MLFVNSFVLCHVTSFSVGVGCSISVFFKCRFCLVFGVFFFLYVYQPRFKKYAVKARLLVFFNNPPVFFISL